MCIWHAVYCDMSVPIHILDYAQAIRLMITVNSIRKFFTKNKQIIMLKLGMLEINTVQDVHGVGIVE